MSIQKVLLVIDSLGPGGAQNQLSLLAVLLKKRGLDVHVLIYHERMFFADRLREKDIPLHIVLRKKPFGYNVILTLYRLQRKERFSAVISFLDTPNFYAALMKRVYGKQLRFVASYRTLTRFNRLSTAEYLQKLFVNNVADVLTANSHHERMRWIEKQPKLTHKWKTIYNAVSGDLFPKVTGGWNNTSLLVVGTIGEDKKGLLIIEALHILKQKGLSPTLSWVSQDVSADSVRNEYHRKMCALIARHNLQDSWNWKRPTTTIVSEFRLAKALVLASNREGLPNVVCEAMHAGLPCIVSHTLDHPLMIEHKKTGFLFRNEDATSLAENIAHLLALDQNTYTDIAENARASALRLFGEERFASEYMETIH